jgi:HSP20 family protein
MLEKVKDLIQKRSREMTDRELTTSAGNGNAIVREHLTWLTPAIDIHEDAEGLTLLADLPGVGKKDLHINIEQEVLTIEGHLQVPSDGEFYRREFASCGYFRRFQLPEHVDVDQIRAEMKDGVLTLRLPKAEAARPRRIEVTVH